MYQGLLHAHSGLRWIVLIAALYAIVAAYKAWKANTPFAGAVKSAGTLFVSSLHLQFILGLVVYFQSQWFTSLSANFGAAMKDSTVRFYALEHPIMMLLAVVLATIGSAKSKKKANDADKAKTRFIWFTIALVIILVAIPWPFRFESASWF